jgi:hypothetical protein
MIKESTEDIRITNSCALKNRDGKYIKPKLEALTGKGDKSNNHSWRFEDVFFNH